jgi:threonine dehydratase
MQGRERDRRQPAQRHAHDVHGVDAQVGEHGRQVIGVAVDGQLTGRVVTGTVAVTMTWQVGGHQRQAKGYRHGVPRMRVLRTAVHEQQLWPFVAPHQRTQLAAVRCGCLDTSYRRRAVIGQPVLVGVLMEQPELVVGNVLTGHALLCHAVEPAVGPDDIARAAHRLQGFVRRTPVISLDAAELGLPMSLALKLELMQHVGSFKPRGAFHRVLAARSIPDTGVIAASGGNHGAAVAFVAHRLGLPAEIFVPASAPAAKRDRIAALGATLHLVDGLYDDAQAAATARQGETGALAVHPFEHVDVIAGQGTMGFELDEQVPHFDTVLVAAGGGGFIAGQAAWFGDRRRVVSVEPFTSRCLHAAREAGSPIAVDVGGVASDSLGARTLGDLAWSIIRRHVDDAVLVSDDDIRAAQRLLWDRLRLVAEPGGATALAALLSGAYVPAADERVVVVVCGSNCDPNTVLE